MHACIHGIVHTKAGTWTCISMSIVRSREEEEDENGHNAVSLLLSSSSLLLLSVLLLFLRYTQSCLSDISFPNTHIDQYNTNLHIHMHTHTHSQADGDLLPVELDEIWKNAPKFPTDEDRIDVDSFVQVYRDIDDLFEEDDDDSTKTTDSVNDTAAATTTVAKDEVTVASESAVPAVQVDLTGVDKELGQAFLSLCDNTGMITKDSLQDWDEIDRLMQEDLVEEDELEEIWAKTATDETMDIQGFLAFNKELDSLFEEDDEDDEPEQVDSSTDTVSATTLDNDTDTPPMPSSEDELTEEEEELMEEFRTICDESDLAGRDAVRQWNDVVQLVDDNLLSEEEFDSIWADIPKVSSSDGRIDKIGFITFNSALDDLFEFEEETNGEAAKVPPSVPIPDTEADVPKTVAETPKQRSMVEAGDLPPGVLFASLVDNDTLLVGKDDLMLWQELNEMLDEGDLLEAELQSMFDANAKDGKLDEDGFIALYEAIDDLFEDDDDNDTDGQDDTQRVSQAKQALLAVVENMNSDEERLPCGLESTPEEETQIMKIVRVLEDDDANQVRQRGGEINQEELNGDWELLYSSSEAMKFNKGLSGLGGSVPNGKFGGLKQTLVANRYVQQ